MKKRMKPGEWAALLEELRQGEDQGRIDVFVDVYPVRKARSGLYRWEEIMVRLVAGILVVAFMVSVLTVFAWVMRVFW